MKWNYMILEEEYLQSIIQILQFIKYYSLLTHHQ